jgi:hypothetical protein
MLLRAPVIIRDRKTKIAYFIIRDIEAMLRRLWSCLDFEI